MRLTSEERIVLQRAAEGGMDALDRAIRDRRRGNPHAFHDRRSLRERVFLVEPRQLIPLDRFILATHRVPR
jgi:hypothetical protein